MLQPKALRIIFPGMFAMLLLTMILTPQLGNPRLTLALLALLIFTYAALMGKDFLIECVVKIIYRLLRHRIRPVALIIDDQGLHLIGPNGVHHTPWQSFSSMFQTTNLFVLCTSPHFRIVIPKRAFPADALPAVLEFCKSRINPPVDVFP